MQGGARSAVFDRIVLVQPSPSPGVGKTDVDGRGYVSRMSERESEQKKVALTAIRIPLLILGALVVMLVIGMLIVG
jgi:hypothetical protein